MILSPLGIVTNTLETAVIAFIILVQTQCLSIWKVTRVVGSPDPEMYVILAFAQWKTIFKLEVT